MVLRFIRLKARRFGPFYFPERRSVLLRAEAIKLYPNEEEEEGEEGEEIEEKEEGEGDEEEKEEGEGGEEEGR